MPRKKITEDESELAAAVNLRDDEVIEIEDRRTIGKKKREAKPPEPDEPDDREDEGELVEEFEFPDGTIGALLNRSDETNFEDQQATILVVRKPDSAGEKFATPCPSRLNLQPIRNVEMHRPVDEIEDVIRMTYGGGHYYCQIRIGNQIQTGFSLDIADPPNTDKQPEPQTVQMIAAAEPSSPPANPLDSFFENIEKMQRLKAALFGDRERELEKQIEDLKQEVRDARNNQQTPEQKSESLLILEKALSANNPDLTERLLDMAFPSENGSGHWLADAIKVVIEHRAEIGEIVTPLLTGTAAPRALPAGSVAGILAKQPPTNTASPRSRFTRRPPEPAALADEKKIDDSETKTDEQQ